MYTRSLMWFRRDLRLKDNTALNEALEHSQEVIGLFIFDTHLLKNLDQSDRRIAFIHESLSELHQEFSLKGGALYVLYGIPQENIISLAKELAVEAVFTNHDYEPYAIERDEEVAKALSAFNIPFKTFKDQVIFERLEVCKKDQEPYQKFTPFKNAWLTALRGSDYDERPSLEHVAHLRTSLKNPDMPSLQTIGFASASTQSIPTPSGSSGGESLLEDFIEKINSYGKNRDFPAAKNISFLSVHLRFGTISIRECIRVAQNYIAKGSPGAEVWLNELIWREFYFSILANFPNVIDCAFKPNYQKLKFNNDQRLFEKWKNGETGYPIVDAAMRQLNATGYMHNRLRLIAATFLIRNLHIDWRWGERYFAECLNDFELASNNGNWQWCASTGSDAQPYFRVFNPILQSKKFDPEGKFIREYVPEIAHLPNKTIHTPWMSGQKVNYPDPVVDFSITKNESLARYKQVSTA